MNGHDNRVTAESLSEAISRNQVAVFGIGITGKAVTEALIERGATPMLFDDRCDDQLRQWAAGLGLEVSSGDSATPTVLSDVAVLFPAPGLAEHHQIFEVVAGTDIGIASEFDLASLLDERPIVSITGTDGKTTVVTMVTEMLTESGLVAEAVGNTDTPLVAAIANDLVDVFVVEASSFRLADSSLFAPRVATWLNFGPDHLDAHRDLDSYAAAKASIWSRLGPDDVAIANRNDAVVTEFAARLTGQVETFGADDNGAHRVAQGWLIVDDQPLVEVNGLARRLPHDVMNALAAAVTAIRAGAQRQAVVEVLTRFTGLEHRMEFVTEIANVSWYNDSKATTPHATAAGLGGFESVVLLAGGKNKGLDLHGLAEHRNRLRAVVALGEAAGDIDAVFGEIVETVRVTSMAEAVAAARSLAEPGDSVVLSPACASFDWYRNYRARGEHFKQLVLQLEQTEPSQ